MSYARSAIKRGRGQVQLGGETLFARDQISVNWLHRSFALSTANSGNVDLRDSDRMIEIRLTPVGQITDELLAVTHPHLTKAYGAAGCGSSDAAATVYFEADDQLMTVHNAVVFQMPDLNLRGGQTAFGPMVIHGLVKNSTDPGAANSYYTLSTSSYPDDAAFDASQVGAGIFSAAWGSSPWDAWHSDDGFRVQFGTEMVADGPDGLTRDYKVGNQTVRVTCRPKGITMAQLEAKLAARFQGTSAPIGSTSLRGNATNLNISNGDLYFRLYSADIETCSVVGHPMQDITGPITFGASRTQTSGVDNPVAYVGEAAPA